MGRLRQRGFAMLSRSLHSGPSLSNGVRTSDEILPGHDIRTGYVRRIYRLKEDAPREALYMLDSLTCLESFHAGAVTGPGHYVSVKYSRIHRLLSCC